jgi:Flp pilus assembly CpaE family ATPase
MLSLALFTPNADTAYCVEQVAVESNQFTLVVTESPIPPVAALFSTLKRFDPEVILLDLSDWDDRDRTALDENDVAGIARHIQASDLRAIVIGFRKSWSRAEQKEFAAAGIADLLHQPFSSLDLEKTVYEALHRDRPVSNPNILAFLPAKAGGGCSVVTVNTAAAMASQFHQRVLLLEADRRSGPFALMLNIEPHLGLPHALKDAASMTSVAWQQQYVETFGMHILLAEPGHRGPNPLWSDYYQLLRFVQERYDFVFVDLPELVNEASAEVVRSARGVFLVCTPEVPSLRMASQRCVELEEYEVPRDRIHILLNRQERGGLPLQDIEKALGRPVFATLPNDYRHVQDAIVESRLVASGSAFGASCQALARKVSGLPKSSRIEPTFGILSKLRKLAG